MHPCDLYCQIFGQPWSNIVTIIACVVLSFYGIYALYRTIHEAKKIAAERQQRREEREREWNFMQYRMKSMIRVAEEWCADASEAKDFLAKSQQMLREAKKIDGLPYRAMSPVLLIAFLAIIMVPFPQVMTIVLLFALPALIWFVFCTAIWQIKRRTFFTKYLSEN